MGSRAAISSFLRLSLQDHGELGVEVPEHVKAVLVVERQDDLAVGVGLELVALGLQLGL